MRAPFLVCPICKDPGWRNQCLCRPCARRLLALRHLEVRGMEGLVSKSLFGWGRQSPRALTDLVYSLKRRDRLELWTEFAVWLAELTQPPRDAIIVPIPGQAPNHAFGFARALARVLHRPVHEPLVSLRTGSHKQRERPREERRAETAFRLRWLDPCSDYRSVLLVDDVITTGATARAAFKALGEPNRCEIWCLLDRRSCDET